MPADRSRLLELHEQLQAKVAGLITGEDWLRWLAAARQFHRYSPRNQMLLALQGAEGLVASYRTWQRVPAEGGGTCQVRKGEHGMAILAPMTVRRSGIDEAAGDETDVPKTLRGFKVVKVFHQGQLVSAPDLPEPTPPKLLTGPDRHQHVWAAVQSHLEQAGWSLELVTRSPINEWNGYTDHLDRKVVVSDHLQPPGALKTLLHEWAHITLEHATRPIGRAQMEVEAESVAYLLCATVGVDSSDYTIPYVAGWSAGDSADVVATAERVLATSSAMVETLERLLDIDVTIDPLAASEQAPVRKLRHHESDPTRHPSQQRPIMLPAGPPTPPLETATGEVRQLLIGLEDERHARVVDALAEVNRNLDDLVGCCGHAGFDAARTISFLRGAGADGELLFQAMVRDSRAHPVPDSPLSDREIVATLRQLTLGSANIGSDQHSPRYSGDEQYVHGATLGRLHADDQALLRYMNMTDPEHRQWALDVVDDRRVTATSAVAVLRDLGVDVATAIAAVNEPRYNPATGRMEPRWPATALIPSEPPTQPPRPVMSGALPVVVVAGIVATQEPELLARFAEAFALDPQEAVSIWADHGANPELAARASKHLHHGDATAAKRDLRSSYPDGAAIDWDQYLSATPTGGLVQADPATAGVDGILAEWKAQHAATNGSLSTPDLGARLT